MSRKPRRPTIAGLRREGRLDAPVCGWCFDQPWRRPLPTEVWKDPHDPTRLRTGCPGCGGKYEQEFHEYSKLTLEEAAWQLLENQNAREAAGVSTFAEALEAVRDLFDDPNPKSEGKRAKYCNVCFGLAHRRPPLGKCPGCKGCFAPEPIAIATGMQSTLAPVMDLDSIA